MARMMVLFAVGILAMTNGLSGAQSTSDAAQENAQLRRRVENLEKQVEELKASPNPGTQEPAPQGPAKSALSELEDGKKPLWSSLDIQFYGYIKADAIWDSSRVYTGNYILYAEQGGEDDEEFNLTARQTRLGVKIKGPELGEARTSGQFEGDFYGAGGEEHKSNFRMRHAFLQLDWPEDRFSILAGQTWDVISPLNPDMLNFTILWDGGNIGHRHPQIRVTKAVALRGDVDLQLAGAISRTIGDLEGQTTAGEDAGVPTLQARAGLTFPWLGIRPTVMGVSGHWGQEEYAGNNDVDSWSLNFDMTQPVNSWLTVRGEAFVGENLDNYFGGIGQGVRNPSTTADQAIDARGGWVAGTLTPYKKWRFNVGFGIDDVDSSDLGASGRTLNRSIFGNAIYAINDSTEVGVELSKWKTDYRNGDDADDLRIQTSFIYKF